MKKPDYFLNCHSEESIKIRYRKLARELHPDKSKDPDAKEKFQEMTRQRDRAFKDIYRKSGKTDQEIDSLLNDFVTDLDKLNFSKLNSVAESFADEVIEKFGENASKEDIFKHIFSRLMGAEQSKGLDPGKKDQKRLK